MSEENKNRNKDKGRQNNRIKYPNQAADIEAANENESEFLNINGKKNKRKRD